MTNLDATKFINNVKGKHIKWMGWKDKYFVPSGILSYVDGVLRFKGTTVYSDHIKKEDIWAVGKGLTSDGWFFVEDAPSTKEFSNTCNHEWIDVGFMHHKFVCKHCNVERKV